ncbi:sugar ABC transporter permease [Paenibacillus sp. PK3_47]|uniref:ABC transporter permease n=1 Tax=Paenibacillus sp. PK3_47 TaxID=2072642 RepID=UPI00201DFE7C|nr:ABC transporter permease subunit [Paenibacillus sp. PK3_47]UQZ33413.1 sugar ABC transporter permease [Paenibacillus sp. PK3_47]
MAAEVKTAVKAVKRTKLERKGGGLFKELARNKVLYLMFVPIALYFIIFNYIPMAGIVVAFKSFNYQEGMFGSPWTGFDNFEYFFSSGKAWLVTKNTFMYNSVFLAAYLFFSILVAVLIAEMSGKIFKKTTQTLLFLPYFLSWVAVAAIVYNLFNYEYGLLNSVLTGLGLDPVDIYSSTSYWYFILPFFYVWKWVGFGSVLYLSAIMGFDTSAYEAAKIDGANVFQRVRYLTIPLLKPTTIILLLLGIGRIMRGEFDMFYQLIGNNGILMDATDIIDTLVFRSLIVSQDFGMASAGGLYQSVLCFVIIMIANGLVKRYDRDQALF